MSTSNELIIRIKDDGSVSVEECRGGVTSYKAIAPDSLLNCINKIAAIVEQRTVGKNSVLSKNNVLRFYLAANR